MTNKELIKELTKLLRLPVSARYEEIFEAVSAASDFAEEYQAILIERYEAQQREERELQDLQP